jgi:outer membrane protein
MTNNPTFTKSLLYVSISFAIAATVISLVALMQTHEIVYVDSLKLFANYKGSLKAKTEYEKKLGQWKANVDTLTSELNNSFAKYEKEKAGMSVKERKLSDELLMTKRQQLDNYRAAVSENASKEDQAITGQVKKEINDFIKKYGESHGYDFIFGLTNTGNLVFARTGKDITDDLLKELNSQYQGK